MSDEYSPWPDEGKWFRFEMVSGYEVKAEPYYGELPLASLKTLELSEVEEAPFLSVRIPHLFHFYIGHKPITLEDPKFYWREHPVVKPLWKAGELFYQRSSRWGLGEID